MKFTKQILQDGFTTSFEIGSMHVCAIIYVHDGYTFNFMQTKNKFKNRMRILLMLHILVEN